jgi:hypothetical protein
MEEDAPRRGLPKKPRNSIDEPKGLGRGVFGEPLKYQKKLRGEWEENQP